MIPFRTCDSCKTLYASAQRRRRRARVAATVLSTQALSGKLPRGRRELPSRRTDSLGRGRHRRRSALQVECAVVEEALEAFEVGEAAKLILFCEFPSPVVFDRAASSERGQNIVGAPPFDLAHARTRPEAEGAREPPPSHHRAAPASRPTPRRRADQETEETTSTVRRCTASSSRSSAPV